MTRQLRESLRFGLYLPMMLPAFRQVYREVRDNELCRLAIQYGSDKGAGSHNYTRVYERILSPFRQNVRTMVEIGLLREKERMEGANGSVQTTGLRRAPSMEMWSRYFPNAELIGFDIADFSQCKIERCRMIQGDQGRREDLLKIRDMVVDSSLDVVIDDGSHASWDQQVTLAVLFPLVRPGGVYFIEDLNWQPDHPQEHKVPKTVEFLESLRSGRTIETSAMSMDEATELRNSIQAIEFYDTLKLGSVAGADRALAVIRKAG